jgi:hypothetical protein
MIGGRQHLSPLAPFSLARRNPVYAGQPRLLRRLLCKKHLVQLQAAMVTPTPWLNSRATSANVLYVLDSGASSELLHQCYAYLTYGTGEVQALAVQVEGGFGNWQLVRTGRQRDGGE